PQSIQDDSHKVVIKKDGKEQIERPRSQSEPIKNSSSLPNGTDRNKVTGRSQEHPQSIQDDSHKVVIEKDGKEQIERPKSQSEPIQKSSSSPNGTDRKKVTGRSLERPQSIQNDSHKVVIKKDGTEQIERPRSQSEQNNVVRPVSAG
ncbi:hypothetical protein, partial [Anaeromicropila populeti]